MVTFIMKQLLDTCLFILDFLLVDINFKRVNIKIYIVNFILKLN